MNTVWCVYVSLTPHTVITVQVTFSCANDSLTTGQTGFSLSCDVSETDNLNSPTFIYQWKKNGSVISDQQGRTFSSLSPLTASNAAQFTCEVTVSSPSLNESITVTSSTIKIQCMVQ